MIFPIIKIFVSSIEDLPKNKGDPFKYLEKLLKEDKEALLKKEQSIWQQLELVAANKKTKEKHENNNKK